MMQPKAYVTLKRMLNFVQQHESPEEVLSKHNPDAFFRVSFQDYDEHELENIINDETYAVNHSAQFTLNPVFRDTVSHNYSDSTM